MEQDYNVMFTDIDNDEQILNYVNKKKKRQRENSNKMVMPKASNGISANAALLLHGQIWLRGTHNSVSLEANSQTAGLNIR